VAETAATTLVDVGGVAGTDYGYTVLAVIPGQASAASAPTSVHWLPATTQPVALRIVPDTNRIGGAVRLSADVQSGDGSGQVGWMLSGPLGSVSIGTSSAIRMSGDPLAWTSTVNFDSTSVPDGTYTLSIRIQDASGNVTAVNRTVVVSNAGPAQPSGFAAASMPSGVALTWEQPAAANAALYRLSRDGYQLVELPADRRSYVDAAASTGAHAYQLVVVDGFGSTSEPVATTLSVASPATENHISLDVRLPGGEHLAPDGLAGGHLILTAAALRASTPVTFKFSPDGAAWSQVAAQVTC
jgi:hypothetical protein